MIKGNSFRRFAAAGTLFGALVVGAVLPADASETLAQHGYWASVMAHDGSGGPVCGVQTSMTHGGTLGLLVADGGVHLVARDPGWRLTTGGVSAVTIDVDGETFHGQAKAIDRQTLLVTSLTRSFVDSFIGGTEMVTDFGGVRWDVSLIGSSSATRDMASCAAVGGSV